MKNNLLKKIALTGMLSAFALIAFMLESLLPPLILPGARLGVSNVFILLTVLLVGSPYAYAVLLVKVVLGSVFAGNVSAIMYSLPSGLISLTLEVVLLYFNDKFGVISVSVFGGGINLTVQNVMFAIITGVPAQLAYLPYFALIGVLSGGVVGVIVYFTNAKLPSSLKQKFID